MARVAFESIFQVNPNGTIEPKQTTRIGGVTITPGITFSKGVGVGGIDLTQFIDHDLEITTDNGVIVITGIY
ncbi:MAG: hypothetical protein HY429_00745 [Candidatus Levybacteria bacterium]|nr:hypothetical protein [Candidatus Levybacteria bacterium]